MRPKVTPTAFELSPALPEQQVDLPRGDARQVDYRRWLVLGLVLLAAALFNGWQRSAPVSHGYRLAELERLRTQEDALGRHLLLEVATLKSPERIERLAVNRLKLVAPDRRDAIVIERIVPPPQPPASVVASR